MLNFNDPIEVTEIFRISTPAFKDKKVDFDDSDEESDEDFIQVLNPANFKTEEYSMKTALLWEDIKCLKQYCYNDEWKTLKGEKFYITTTTSQHDLLVLGSYHNMLQYWKQFRNAYPLQ